MAESTEKESIIIKDESSPLGIFLVKSGSKGDRLLFRFPYELTDNQTETTPAKTTNCQLTDDKYDYKATLSYDSGDSSRRLTPSESSLVSSNSNLNSCILGQIEKKKNPYALIEDNNDSLFNYNLGFNSSTTNTVKTTVKTPTATLANDFNPFQKFNTGPQFNNNKNSNLKQKFTTASSSLTNSSPSNKIDSCLLNVINLPDKILSDLLAVKSDLCGNKFELKINDVRFVGHPVLLSSKNNFQSSSSNVQNNDGKNSRLNKDLEKDLVTFNVVFALRANASQEIVKCYYDCSKRIAIALHFEEQRVGYLTSETKTMTAHDDNQDNEQIPYSTILEKSTLAKTLKKMYEDLSRFGALYLRINSWIEVSFCLPQKVHKLTLKYHERIPLIDPSEIQKSLESLRPYHGVLLLVDPRDLFDTLPLDAAPALIRVIRVISPVKNLLDLSADADISLKQVFHIVAQLVYWAKATIIYPFCDNNVYMINPLAPLAVDSPLVKKFEKEFPKSDLLKLLSEFSFGVSISHLRNPMMMDTDQQTQLIHKVIWLLKHRLLLQIHTYVYLIPLNCSMPYLTKKVNNYLSLNNKTAHHHTHHHHHTRTESSSTSYDMKAMRISIDTNNENLDISVESSSFSENDSLDTSPINFNTNTNSTTSTSNLNSNNLITTGGGGNNNSSNLNSVNISNSYPQQNSFMNSSSSSFDNNRFDINNLSSSLSVKKLHRSSLNIATSSCESKLLNAEVFISRHAMVQQHQQQQIQNHQQKLFRTATQQTNNISDLNNENSSYNNESNNNNLITDDSLTTTPAVANNSIVNNLTSTTTATTTIAITTTTTAATMKTNNGTTSTFKKPTTATTTTTTKTSLVALTNNDDSEEEDDEVSIEETIEGNGLEILKVLGLSKAECECILNIPASKNFEDLRLFARLCPYFNGRHHLEDIMYYANVRRSALLALIDKYRDVLFTAQYEDESVSHLCPYIQNE